MNMRSVIIHSLAAACVATLLVGCGRKNTDTSAVLAKVNNENITQAQLDFARTQIAAAHPGAPLPDNAQLLQGLVEQHLVSQKAEKDKLDRNPGVLQALEAARKDALARYYVEQLVAKVPKPSADEIKAYYDSHPLNFSQRNVYMIQKIDARVPAEQAEAISMAVKETTTPAAAVELMKGKASAVNVSQTPQPAETLGALLPKMAELPVGHTLTIRQPQGMTALTLVSVTPQAVTLAQASPSIEQLLWNQRKRELLQTESKKLHAAAKIEYLGKFAAGAASAPAVGAADAASVPVLSAPDVASAASQ